MDENCALHVVDSRQLGIDQQVDVAQQVLQEGITLLVEGGLVALHTISPLRMVERERRGGLMVHFRAFMCCCVVPLALLQNLVQTHKKASCLNDQSLSQVASRKSHVLGLPAADDAEPGRRSFRALIETRLPRVKCVLLGSDSSRSSITSNHGQFLRSQGSQSRCCCHRFRRGLF
jgi:hypothetical protein